MIKCWRCVCQGFEELVLTLNEQNAAIFSGTTLSDSLFTQLVLNTHTDDFAFSLIELNNLARGTLKQPSKSYWPLKAETKKS